MRRSDRPLTGEVLPAWALLRAAQIRELQESQAERAAWFSVMVIIGLASALVGCWLRGW